jgi:hypothetical protein
MPSGKGTYGSKMGRPKKNNMRAPSMKMKKPKKKK